MAQTCEVQGMAGGGPYLVNTPSNGGRRVVDFLEVVARPGHPLSPPAAG